MKTCDFNGKMTFENEFPQPLLSYIDRYFVPKDEKNYEEIPLRANLEINISVFSLDS